MRISDRLKNGRTDSLVRYPDAELRAKELQTIAFFLILTYFAVLAGALFI